jgi:FAD/FMN-containing dehydrogenase
VDSSVLALVLEEIRQTIGADRISLDEDDLKTYGRDWTKAFAPRPSVVVFPRSTAEVSRILALCSQHDIAVVPSGGRTGLAGGAVAANGEMVLSLVRMDRVGDVDPIAQTLWVEAGAITEAVHHKTAEQGLTWPVDFASKGSSHIGGNIATNAGGVRVIRYGLTRNWVLGLKVVLMSGEVLSLNGALEKNNTGFDLRQAFIGTEGTLGVITEATLKLTRLPGASTVAFFGLQDLDRVFDLFLRARKSPFVMTAFECLSRGCLQAVLDVQGLRDPLPTPSEQYVLLEIEEPQNEVGREALDTWLVGCLDEGIVETATLAQSPKEVQEIWALREGVAESLGHKGRVHKHDISLPISQLQNFLNEWGHALGTQYQGMAPYIFGHIGDGNLHVNVLQPQEMSSEEFEQKVAGIDQAMFSILQKYQGSVSAEHGIGLLKKDLLQFSKSPLEMRLMRSLKQVFDPKNLLNPGKIFDGTKGS